MAPVATAVARQFIAEKQTPRFEGTNDVAIRLARRTRASWGPTLPPGFQGSPAHHTKSLRRIL